MRRKYLDSVSNEGVGTYLEEMLLHAGLFDDQPHTRVDIWRYRRCLLVLHRSSRPTMHLLRLIDQVTHEATAQPLLACLHACGAVAALLVVVWFRLTAAPPSGEYRYYRLRVLRIAADLKLGCGTEDLEWAATYLEHSGACAWCWLRCVY